jgi:hypothetical protein
MSFGLGVGDIVLVSQLAYKLYGTLSSGRRDADGDFQEVQNALFGLRCALDHLARVRTAVTADNDLPSDAMSAQNEEVQAKFGQIIQGCNDTLQELDAAVERFRDGMNIANSGGSQESAGGPPTKRLKPLADKLRTNVTRIRWDLSKKDLKCYRDRLQLHADAINILLNTILWYVQIDVNF